MPVYKYSSDLSWPIWTKDSQPAILLYKLVESFYREDRVVVVGWGRETNEGSRGEGLRRRIKVFNNFMFMK